MGVQGHIGAYGGSRRVWGRVMHRGLVGIYGLRGVRQGVLVTTPGQVLLQGAQEYVKVQPGEGRVRRKSVVRDRLRLVLSECGEMGELWEMGLWGGPCVRCPRLPLVPLLPLRGLSPPPHRATMTTPVHRCPCTGLQWRHLFGMSPHAGVVQAWLEAWSPQIR